MGFVNKKSSPKTLGKQPGKSSENKHEYRKIGSMWESKKFEGHNMSFDDYFGDLIFREKETGNFYKVKSASLFNPKEGAPDNLVYNLVVDLKSEYSVELLEEGAASGEEESEQQDSSERFSRRRG